MKENQENEIWVPLYDSVYYQISNLGRFRSLERKVVRKDGIEFTIPAAILKKILDRRSNQYIIYIRQNGRSKRIAVTYAVAVHFVPKEDDSSLIYARQIIQNNDFSAANIRWITRKEARNNPREKYAEKSKIRKHFEKGNTKILPKIKPLEKQYKKKESWTRLYDYTGYEVSNYGRIRSVERLCVRIDGAVVILDSRILSQRHTKTNPHYFSSIQIHDENGSRKNKTIYLHKAVADHFVEKPEHIIEIEKNGGKVYASHIIKDYSNNHYSNIHFISQPELIASQPKRLADPTKSWRTRREIYGKSGSKPDSLSGKVPRKKRRKIK